MRASITRISNRIKELEEKVDQSTTFDLAKRDKNKLISLDSEFKVHHYAVVDILEKDEDLAKEQEVLDEHGDTIAELAIRIQKLISTCSAPSDPNPRMIQLTISDLQISPLFPRNISKWNINVRLSEGSSPRALSNGACNAIVDKTVAKPRPPKVSPIQTKTKLVAIPLDRFSWLRSQ